MNRNIIWVIVLIIAAGGAFWGGMSYAQSQASAARSSFAAGAGGSFAGRTGTRTGAAAGGLVAGQIVSSGNGSISIQMQNSSSSEIVLIGSNTQILKTVSGSASDLTVGANVTVTGTTNSDGSISATSVQIRPAGTAGGFPGGRTGTGAAGGTSAAAQ